MLIFTKKSECFDTCSYFYSKKSLNISAKYKFVVMTPNLGNIPVISQKCYNFQDTNFIFNPFFMNLSLIYIEGQTENTGLKSIQY